MILVDANLLLYAEDATSPHHDAARAWWDAQLSGISPVGLCWPVISAFIRVSTNPRIYAEPLSVAQAAERVDSWLAQPCVRVLAPTSRHWQTFRGLLEQTGATGNLVSDAHLAALAIEHGCRLCSADTDFARFRGLDWENPVA